MISDGNGGCMYMTAERKPDTSANPDPEDNKPDNEEDRYSNIRVKGRDKSNEPGPEPLFLFADYSLWAHAYAIRLGASDLKKNEIFVIGGDYPMLLFHSFSELIESYLADKSLMFENLKGLPG